MGAMKIVLTLLLTIGLGKLGCASHERFQRDHSGGEAMDPEAMECAQVTLSSETPIYFRSPGTYPYNYPNNHDSCWVVTSDVPDVEPRIRVTFSAIEALLGMRCSVADYLEVRDGDNYNSTLILRWCGWGHPEFPFVASNDSLYVRFHTDSSISYGGFEMKAYVNETAHAMMSSYGGPITFPPLGQLPGRGLLPGRGRQPEQPGQEGTGQPQRPEMGPHEEGSDPSQRSFNNDQDSRNNFNNNLRRNNLGASTSGKDTGMIVGIVLAVLVGVSLIGVVIHVLTKCYTNKNRPPWNPLENVIIPNRRRREGFDNLDAGGAVGGVGQGVSVAGTGGGVVSGKYALPGPMVSAPPTGYHPPPGPLVTGTQPHPGLVFAYSSAQPSPPGTGNVNQGFASPDPDLTPSIPPSTTAPTEANAGRTLTTTIASDAHVPQNPGSGMTDLYADQDIGTPRLNNEGVAGQGALPRQLPSLGPNNASALPPLTMGATFGPTSSGMVPVPPVYTSNVSLPPSYEDVSYS